METIPKLFESRVHNLEFYAQKRVYSQLKLLNNLAKYVKVGGNLYYSTCSILKDENDRIIEKFLKENSNFVCERVNSKLDNLKTEYGLTFLPNISSSAGFYFSKLKRVDKQ